jgi:hypothetical protein
MSSTILLLCGFAFIASCDLYSLPMDGREFEPSANAGNPVTTYRSGG